MFIIFFVYWEYLMFISTDCMISNVLIIFSKEIAFFITKSGWPSGLRRQTQEIYSSLQRSEHSGPQMRAWVRIPLLTQTFSKVFQSQLFFSLELLLDLRYVQEQVKNILFQKFWKFSAFSLKVHSQSEQFWKKKCHCFLKNKMLPHLVTNLARQNYPSKTM